MRFIDAGVTAGFSYGGENILGADVADEVISGEWAAAESRERAVEAPASGVVGCEDLCCGVFSAAMEVSAKLDSCDVLVCAIENFGDNFGSGVASGVSERNGSNSNILEPFEGFFDQFRSPRLVVRIAERHRNVNQEATSCGFGFLVESSDQRPGFAASHVGIRPAKIR